MRVLDDVAGERRLAAGVEYTSRRHTIIEEDLRALGARAAPGTVDGLHALVHGSWGRGERRHPVQAMVAIEALAPLHVGDDAAGCRGAAARTLDVAAILHALGVRATAGARHEAEAGERGHAGEREISQVTERGTGRHVCSGYHVPSRPEKFSGDGFLAMVGK